MSFASRILRAVFITVLLPLLCEVEPAFAQQHVYWSDLSAIFRCEIPCSGPIPLVQGPPAGVPNRIAIDDINNIIFWTQTAPNSVWKAGFDGMNQELFMPLANAPFDLAVDPLNGKLYVTTIDGIFRSDLDGGNQNLFLPPQPSRILRRLAVDPLSNFLLFSDEDGLMATLTRVHTSGGLPPEPLYTDTGVGGLTAATISKRLMYTENAGPGLRYVIYEPPSLDSIPLVPLAPPTQLGAIAVDWDESFVYWADAQQGEIRRASLGSLVPEPYITGVIDPRGVALDCGPFAFDGDGDGSPDCADGCPLDPLKTGAGVCGCGIEDIDSDFDGIFDCVDGCPLDSLKTVPGVCGCGVVDLDSDSDGTFDCVDSCPLDSLKTAPGACGCGVADVDGDADGVFDCIDQCPLDNTKSSAGLCGCGVPDTDSDADGTVDCQESCPQDSGKTVAGACGCGLPDIDSDGDGFLDCLDGCPADKLKTSGGICGCGLPDDFTSALVLGCIGLRELSPGTKITEPPIVIINGRNVTVIFESFSAVNYKSKKKEKKSVLAAFLSQAILPANTKSSAKVRYQVVLKKEEPGTRNVKASNSKKNEFTYKNLEPGNYSVKYRAQIVVKGDVVSRTGYSPPAKFSIN